MEHVPLLHEELTEIIRGVFHQVYLELGYGFLESVYASAMACLFHEVGISFERELPIAVHFRGARVGFFRADFLVESKIVLELKAGSQLDPNVEAQLLNCLRATDNEVGMMLYFGPRPVVRRMVYSNERKRKGG